MPAYFDMTLQFLRKDLYPGFVADFDAHLERSGLGFRSGCREDAGLSQAEIAAWNPKKLDANFTLDYTEHYTHDYKQVLYQFEQYERVRGYWMNREAEEDVFTYVILIPEREVLTCEDSVCCMEICFQRERAEELLRLAKRLWQFPQVKAIQTGLELSGNPVELSALEAGQPPCAEAFAILEPGCPCCADGLRAVELTQGRPGVLLLEDKNLPGPIESESNI